ncbi:MAG: suppressor of fused domain protein [Planctomycetota bacterium]
MGVEETPGGDPIHRYSGVPIESEPELSTGDGGLMDALDSHLDTCFPGVPRQVFHELISPTIHLDIHIVPPNEKIDAFTCVTTGMAERPMSFPPGARGLYGGGRYAELVTLLPSDWPLFDDFDPEKSMAFDEAKESFFWPLHGLKWLPRFAHEHGAWFWDGHTIPNGDPAEPIEDTNFIGLMLVDASIAANLPEQFSRFTAGDRDVQLLLVMPLTEGEMDFKLQKGANELLDRLIEADVGVVIDAKRKSAIQKRSRWWPF